MTILTTLLEATCGEAVRRVDMASVEDGQDCLGGVE